MTLIGPTGTSSLSLRTSRSKKQFPSSTGAHCALVAPTRQNPYGIPHLERPTVKGYFFPSSEQHASRTKFVLEEGAPLRYGERSIPNVKVASAFGSLDDITVRRAFIPAYNRVFLVYGFQDDRFPINQMLKKIKPSTEWRGGVVVFCLGKRVPLLQVPNMQQVIIEAVAGYFVSKVTQHLDEGRQIPNILDRL